ncbi:glycine zipper 2TM domain-containing protein [Bordetella muralis]|uniref:glycine zipper 2TM domain-containing protein n=1 Tax=Bordetella muralis TaxID=1649130 RepID=UPI0039F0B9EB
MNTQVPTPGETPRRRLHPLVATAAVSVIVLSTVAVASLLGWIPTPGAEPTGQTPVHEAQVQAEAEAQQASADPDASSGVVGEGETAPPASQADASAQGRTKAPSPAPAKSASVSKSSASQTSAAGKSSVSSATCANCGVVETIRTVQVPKKNEGYNVVGTVAGGVVGGVVGHQFGGGSGKDALTVLGAVGGALAGHEIERNIRQQQTVTHYELTVRMDNGSKRTFRSSQPFAYASGDHVRVENDQLLPR